MATQPESTNREGDYFPGIKSIKVPASVRRVMAQQNINPDDWEADLNKRIQLGGQTKEEALSRAFPLFDQIEGTSRYSGILKDGLQAKESHQQDIEARRAGRRETERQVQALDELPTETPDQPVATSPEERVGAGTALMGSVWNSLSAIVKGGADFINESSRFADLYAGMSLNANGADRARAALAEVNFSKTKKDIEQGFDKIKVDIDAESQKNPISFKKGTGKLPIEIDWSEAKDANRWLAGIGQGVGSLVSILAPTKKASFLMSFLQMYSDNQDAAAKAGVKGEGAAVYAAGTSMVGAALELVGEAGILKSLKGDAGREIIKTVVKDEGARAIGDLATRGITKDIFDEVVTKTFNQSVKELSDVGKSTLLKKSWNMLKKAGRGAGPEAGTEFAQEWSTYAGKTLYNATAGDDAEEGQGRFETNALETLSDATFGMIMGGFLGGAIGAAAKNPKDLHETMGAFVNSDIKDQLTQNPNLSLNDLLSKNRFAQVMEAAKANGQFNDGNGNYSPEMEADIKNKADLLYQTYFEFKDLPAFSAEDKLSMFTVADTRNKNLQQKNQVDQMINQVAEIQSQIDGLKSSGGDPVAVTKLEAQKAMMETNLGPQDPTTGQYERQAQVDQESQRIESIFSQAIPAISGQDVKTKALGRAFLNDNIYSTPDEDFSPDMEATLPNGNVIVRDTDSRSIRQMQTTPIPNPPSILNQVSGDSYAPIPRYQKDFTPVSNFNDYVQAAGIIETNGTKRTSKDTLSPFNYQQDAEDLVTGITQEVAQAAASAALYPQIEARVNDAYDLYNEIVTRDSTSPAPTVLPLTYEEFYGAVGFQAQADPAANPNTPPVDPLEATLLKQQKAFGISGSIADNYLPSVPTLDTILNLEDGKIDTELPAIESAVKELLGLRKFWQNKRRSTRREFTLPQIADIVGAIENDLQLLLNEKSYIEDPDSRPEPQPENQDGENTEGAQGESAVGEGAVGGTEQSRSVKSEYASAAAVEEVLEPATVTEGQLSEQLRSASEAVEAAIQAEGQVDVAGVIAELDRALELIGQSDGQTESITGAIDGIIDEDSGDGSGVEPSAEENEAVKARLEDARTEFTSNLEPLRNPGNFKASFDDKDVVSVNNRGKIQKGVFLKNEGFVMEKAKRGMPINQLLKYDDSTVTNETRAYKKAAVPITDALPTMTAKNSRVGVRKDQRRIVDPERIKAIRKFPNNPLEEVYQYFVRNGQINTQSLNDFYVKKRKEQEEYRPGDKTANAERKEMVGSTAEYGLTIDQLAHKLYEETEFPGMSDADFKELIEDTILSFPGLSELTKRLNKELSEFPDVDPDELASYVPSEEQPEGFEPVEEVDEDEVPFSDKGENVSTPQTQRVLTQLAKAFPGINTNIAKNQQEYIDKLNSLTNPQQLFTKDNVPYGFINPIDGSINLDPSRLNPNTAIHEYGHVWLYNARVNNPDLHRKGQDLVKDTVYYRKAKNNPLYSGMSEDKILDEALAAAIGDKGAAFISQEKKGAFRTWLDKLFDGVKQLFGMKAKPAQIADMNFNDFTKAAVDDLLSGDTVSQMTSEQVAAILQSTKTAKAQPEPQAPDLLYHHTPVTWGAASSGEIIGTSQQWQDEVRNELTALGIYGKLEENASTVTRSGATTTTKVNEYGLSAGDKKQINALARKYGWKYLGAKVEEYIDPATGNPVTGRNKERWVRDISKERTSFFLKGGKMVMVPLKGMSNAAGRLAETIKSSENWLEGLRESGNPIFKTATWLIDSSFDRLNNLEVFTKAIDSAEGIFHELIHDVKRESADNRNYAMNVMGRAYEDVRRQMGKLSTHKGSHTLDTVQKMGVKVVQWSNSLNKGVERSMMLPVSAIIDIVLKHESQMSMGPEYTSRKVKDQYGVERIEDHSSAVIDSYFAVDPADRTLFWKQSENVDDIHKGVHLKKDIAMEANRRGDLEPLKDKRQYGLFTQAEMDRLVDYVSVSGPAEVRNAYAKVKSAFNDPTIREMLKKENDEINPSMPFKAVPDYAPLQVVSKMNTQDRVNSFSPNLEDARQLNERTSRPDAIYAEDVLDSYDYYKEAVGHILGSSKLVHNLKNIQQAVQSDYEGTMKERVDGILSDVIKNLQNYRQSQYEVSRLERGLKPVLILMSKYTGTIFRSNIGISTKQIGTWASALGLGYIKTKHLFGRNNVWAMARMSVGGTLWDRAAGGTVIETTRKGTRLLRTKYGDVETQEASYLKDLLGDNISDPVLKEQHLRNWATVIQRAVYGQSQYTEGADMGRLRFSRDGLQRVKQLWNYADSMFEEYGMANIRRLDRAVILGYMVAAKQQVQEEVKAGITNAADADARAAMLTTETLYLTNQMNDPADLTMLQRNPSFANKVIAMYSGQTQKLWNQMAGAAIDYFKLAPTATPEVKRLLRNRLVGSLLSNVIVNTMWMSTANLGASILRGWLAGEEDKEDGFYKKKFMWDTARYMTGLSPGIASQFMQFVISDIDNEKWSDEMFDVVGADTATQMWNFAKDVTGLASSLVVHRSEKEMQEYLSGAVFNFGRIFGVASGLPKTWIDPVTKRLSRKIKPPKGLKEDDIVVDDDVDVAEDDDVVEEEDDVVVDD